MALFPRQNPGVQDVCTRLLTEAAKNLLAEKKILLTSLKLTFSPPKKWMVGILVSFWEGLFSGAIFVSGRVDLKFAWWFQPI